MRKVVLSLLAFIVVCIAPSCQEELEVPAVGNDGTTIITAGFDNSKTALQDGGKVNWTSGDAISVNGVASDVLSLGAPAAKADFSFASVLADEKKAVFPASIWTSDGTVTLPAVQNAGTNATFAEGAVPMVAYAASGNTLSFKHIAAVIKIQLKKGATDDNIAYVEFSGKNNEQVSGVFNVDYITGDLTSASDDVADKKVKVTVDKALSSTATVIYIAVPAGTYSKGFTIRVVDENDVTMTKNVGATTLVKGGIYPTPVDTFDADNTIKAFVKSYVNILKVWERNTATIDLLKGEDSASGDWKILGAHYVPSTTTITVGGKTYNTADMFETALRCYLLVRGYNGLETEKYGKGSIPALAGGAVGMSETTVPDTHGYYFGTAPYSETPGNGGFLHTSGGDYHNVKVDILDNWAMRSLNFQHGKAITNICSYSGGQLSGYAGSFCPMRALITYAYFFKYMLDNGFDKGTDVSTSTNIRTELFQPVSAPFADPENNGIWLWSSNMTSLDLNELASKNIKNVFLNEAAFTAYNSVTYKSFIEWAHSLGIKVHAWLQCFYSGGAWVSPVDDENVCYKQDLFNEIIGRATTYLGFGVDGIHLDYVRFPGTASSHNPSAEITAVGAVTEFCRQLNVAVKAVNSSAVISAAMMPEPYSESYYGQNPAQMGQYVDVLMPMVYFRTDGYKNTSSWAINTANHFATRGAPAKVWAGITTYSEPDNHTTTPMTASEIRTDCELFPGTQSEGVVLFRYGLGEVPDLNGLWD